MDFKGENVKGHRFDPVLAKQIQADASANLHSFLDDFDFDKELAKKNSDPILAENNFNAFTEDLGNYGPTDIELNGYFLYASKTDEDSFAIRKLGKAIKYVTVYQALNYHKLDKFIVLPGWDEVLYFNTLTHRMTSRNLR